MACDLSLCIIGRSLPNFVGWSDYPSMATFLLNPGIDDGPDSSIVMVRRLVTVAVFSSLSFRQCVGRRRTNGKLRRGPGSDNSLLRFRELPRPCDRRPSHSLHGH